MPADNRTRGKIMMALLDSCKSTSEIARELDMNLGYIRAQLVRMHHLWMIEPVAIRTDEDHQRFGRPPAVGYFQEFVWQMTTHGKDHNYVMERCYGCKVRMMLLSVDEAIVE